MTTPNFEARAQTLWDMMLECDPYGEDTIPLLTRALEQAYRDGHVAGFEECRDQAIEVCNIEHMTWAKTFDHRADNIERTKGAFEASNGIAGMMEIIRSRAITPQAGEEK